jgi:hypothetical protein
MSADRWYRELLDLARRDRREELRNFFGGLPPIVAVQLACMAISSGGVRAIELLNLLTDSDLPDEDDE